MLFAGVGSSSFAVIPRNDSVQALLPLNRAFVGRPEVWAKNLVPDIHTLMRAFIVVVCQPLPVDVIKLSVGPVA